MRTVSRGILYGIRHLLTYLLILSGLGVCLARLLALSINTFPETAVTGASYLAGVEVSASGLQVRWRGHDPLLLIEDAVLGSDPATALRVRKLDMQIDVLRSLLAGTLAIRHLRIADPELVLQQQGGTWQFAGFALDAGGDTFNIALPGSFRDILANVRLAEVETLSLEVRTGKQIFLLESAAEEPVTLSAGTGYQHLMFDLLVTSVVSNPADGLRTRVAAAIEFGDRPSDPGSFWLRGHVRLPEVDVGGLLASAIGGPVESAKLVADFWFRFEQGEAAGLLEFVLPEVDFQGDRDGVPRIIRDVSGHLTAVREVGNDWRFGLNDFRATVFGKAFSLPDIPVAGTGLDGFIAKLPDLSVRDLDLLMDGQKSSAAVALPWLQILTQLAPELTLAEGYLVFGGGEPRLLARIQELSIASYEGSPSFERLGGVLSMSPASGWAAVDSQFFNMGFVPIFNQPWQLDTGRGLITYEWQGDTFFVLSDLLEVAQGPMRVQGRFLLHLPPDRDNHSWALSLGVTDADVSKKLAYIPTFIGKAYGWVDQALVGGKVKESGMIFHGALSNRVRRERKAFDLYFDAADGILAYHPDWPPVTELSGLVNVSHQGVAAGTVKGKVHDTLIVTERVSIPFNQAGQAEQAWIKGQTSGPAQDVLSFLQGTPLRAILGDVTADWQAEGEVGGLLDLLIPVGTQPEGFCDCRVALDLSGVDLDMRNHRLALSSLDGMIGYDPQLGLYSDQITASFLDRPLTGSISTLPDQGVIRIDLQGRVELANLQSWLDQPVLKMAEGETTFLGNLSLPIGDDDLPGLLWLDSDLYGVTVHLPAPLGKSTEDRVPFSYFSSFGSAEQTVSFQYDGTSEGRLLLSKGDLKAGLVSLYEPLNSEPVESGLAVKGFLPDGDLSAWNYWLQEVTAKLTEESAEADLSGMLREIQIDIGHANIYGLTLPDLRLDMSRSEDVWLFLVDSADVRGEIRAPGKEDTAWDLDLDYLRLGRPAATGANRFVLTDEDEGTDPMGRIDPRHLVPMKFRVGELNWQDEGLGTWSFTLAVDDEGALITDLDATVAGLRTDPLESASGQGTGAWLKWAMDERGHRSAFKGRMRSEDLATALRSWGFKPSLESSDLVLDSELYWSGSPAMASLQRLEGTADIKVGRGRFLQADERAEALKLLGIFDFRSLARRMRLDFSDVTQEGFGFDEISGSVELRPGVIATSKPLEIHAPSMTAKLTGSVDLLTGELDSDMVLNLSLDRNLPWFAALASGTLIGIKVFLVQKLLLGQRTNPITSSRYRVSGTLEEPDIERKQMFSVGSEEF